MGLSACLERPFSATQVYLLRTLAPWMPRVVEVVGGLPQSGDKWEIPGQGQHIVTLMCHCASPLTLRFSPLCGCLEQGLLGNKLLQKLGSFNLERPRGRGLGRLFLLIVLHSPLYLSPLSRLLSFSASCFSFTLSFPCFLPLLIHFLCSLLHCLFPRSSPLCNPFSAPTRREGARSAGDKS